MNKVFVYGTLRKGCTNHYLLDGLPFVDAECEGVVRYWEYGVPFPFAKQGQGKIYGELYNVDNSVLKKLDALEGHPNFYKRQLLNVSDCNGINTQAWIYLIND